MSSPARPVGGEFGEIKDTPNSKLNDGGKKWLKKNSTRIW